MLTDALRAKAKLIKLMIFDVDGIFTDGTIYVDDDGKEIKAFNALDGHGIELLHETAMQTAVISGRKAAGVQHRMQRLGIQHIYLGYSDKLPIYEKLLNQLQLTAAQVAYMGDDLVDLPLLKRVGLPITVPNAVELVRQSTPWMTTQAGGKGAVREACEWIMQAQGTWQTVIADYLK